MLKVIVSTLTAVSLLILVVLLNVTTPSTAGPFGILAVFLFAYLFLMGLLTYLLMLGSSVISYLSITLIARRPFEALSFKRSYYYSSVLAAAPIMVFGLQSVGRVEVYEYFLVLIFVCIGCLYISKRIS